MTGRRSKAPPRPAGDIAMTLLDEVARTLERQAVEAGPGPDRTRATAALALVDDARALLGGRPSGGDAGADVLDRLERHARPRRGRA